MLKNSTFKSDSEILRQKAEELLKLKPSELVSPIFETDMLKLVHELQVHQIELEMQNEELILAKKQAEDAADTYNKLYECALTGYFTLSRDGEILALNLAGASMLGKQRMQLKNSRFGFFVSDDTKKIFNLFLINLFTCKEIETCEVTLTRDGNLPMDVQLQGINTKNDEQCFLLAIDITKRKQAEEKLIAEQNFRNAIESSLTSGLAIVDKEGRQIYVNPSFYRMFDWSEQEFIGQTTPYVYWPPEHLQAINEAFKITLAGKAPKEGFELVFVRKDGVLVPVQVIISPFSDGKEILGWLANVIDITERKRFEAELQLKNEQLHKANLEKDKFFSIVAHDLRSPFQSLLGLTRLLVEDLPTITSDQTQKLALAMKNSANKLFNLLENLLEWSMMQRGITSFEPNSFILLDGVSPIIELFRDTTDKKMIRIGCDIPEDLRVSADSHMFKSLISNLVSNAAKFTPKGGSINIAAKPISDSWVEISIMDTGIGMNKNITANLFSLDEQTNRKGTEGEPSTGLGLLLCKDFVEKHGGKLWVESEEGKGSTFYFTLSTKAAG